jgi:uncharacterized protein (DUF2249 family)
MRVTANTKISELIRHNPDCIDAIAAINKHFEKLKNPILRKVMAGRVTIKDAAKIGNTTVDKFYDVLTAIGFDCEINSQVQDIIIEKPAFVKDLTEENITVLDVREFINSKTDPFLKIMKATEEMPEGKTLLLINTFEPAPLINMLSRKGFESYAERKDEQTVYTYFKKPLNIVSEISEAETNLLNYCNEEEFKTIAGNFNGPVNIIDVREMEMPQPMVTILNETEKLAAGNALYVHHKKIPQYLLPELEENGFKIYINNRGEGDVKLFIIK